MKDRRVEPSSVLGALCVLVGIALVFVLTNQSGQADERSRGSSAPQPVVSSTTSTTTTTTTPVALRTGLVDVPSGMRAMAVRIDFVAGVAGYVAPGDRVDVYSTVGDPEPRTERILSEVEVLDVSTQVAPSIATADAGEPRTETATLTYLLAVTPSQAESLVLHTTTNRIHLTLTPSAAPRG